MILYREATPSCWKNSPTVFRIFGQSIMGVNRTHATEIIQGHAVFSDVLRLLHDREVIEITTLIAGQ